MKIQNTCMIVVGLLVGLLFVGCEHLDLEEVGAIAIDTAAEVAKVALTDALADLASENPEYASAIEKVNLRLQVPFSEASTDPADYLAAINLAVVEAFTDEELRANFQAQLRGELQSILGLPASGSDLSLLESIERGLI